MSCSGISGSPYLPATPQLFLSETPDVLNDIFGDARSNDPMIPDDIATQLSCDPWLWDADQRDPDDAIANFGKDLAPAEELGWEHSDQSLNASIKKAQELVANCKRMEELRPDARKYWITKGQRGSMSAEVYKEISKASQEFIRLSNINNVIRKSLEGLKEQPEIKTALQESDLLQPTRKGIAQSADDLIQDARALVSNAQRLQQLRPSYLQGRALLKKKSKTGKTESEQNFKHFSELVKEYSNLDNKNKNIIKKLKQCASEPAIQAALQEYEKITHGRFSSEQAGKGSDQQIGSGLVNSEDDAATAAELGGKPLDHSLNDPGKKAQELLANCNRMEELRPSAQQYWRMNGKRRKVTVAIYQELDKASREYVELNKRNHQIREELKGLEEQPEIKSALQKADLLQPTRRGIAKSLDDFTEHVSALASNTQRLKELRSSYLKGQAFFVKFKNKKLIKKQDPQVVAELKNYVNEYQNLYGKSERIVKKLKEYSSEPNIHAVLQEYVEITHSKCLQEQVREGSDQSPGIDANVNLVVDGLADFDSQGEEAMAVEKDDLPC